MLASTKNSMTSVEASEYVLRYCPVHPALERLYSKTREVIGQYAIMMADTSALSLVQLLLRAMGAKKYLEIGVFTGCSALSAALALPPDGSVVGLDISQKFADIGRPFWREAGVDHKIDIRIGRAVDSLGALIDENQSGSFDFAFIDADKGGYDTYYECCLKLVRQGGIIAVDNVLWDGTVYDENETSPDTVAIRKINEKIRTDDRVQACMLTIGDGLTLAMKK
ncbi:putative caffeoyl-CoA O-methyltransferase 1 isoform X1 [Haemaphysalis longicornis]